MNKHYFALLAALLLFTGSISVLKAENKEVMRLPALQRSTDTGYIRPHTDNTISLGTTDYRFVDGNFAGVVRSTGSMFTDGNLTVDDILNLDDVFQTIISSLTTTVIPTSSFMIITSTGSDQGASFAWWLPAPGEALISTATAITGDYLIITSTAIPRIKFPTGATHFIVASSSPSYLNTNDSLSLMFDGNYWVLISSSVNN